MMRSISVFASLATALAVSMGCTPEATNKIEKMGTEDASTAKSAAGDMADATGMSDMLSKAKDALSSVEGGSDMLKSVTETFAKATSTFKGVTDADSATAALPDIDKLTESFGGFSEMFGKLPDVAKTAVIGVFTSALGDLKPILDKVLAIPGVESILKPAIDAMLAKIGSFKA